MTHDTRTDDAHGRRHAAGWLDIRTIIGTLLGIYGVVLLLTYAVGGSGRTSKGGTDTSANLWTGLVLLVAGVLFVVWARTRPTVVDEANLAEQKAEADEGGNHSPAA